MIKSIPHETIRQQCLSFKKWGWTAQLFINHHNKICPHHVFMVNAEKKVYCLADPDPDIIIRQLATLYQRTNNEKSY